MRFTRYYSRFLQSQGVPHLDVMQHCRLMNIVSLEGRLAELEALRNELKNSVDQYKYDVRIHRIQLKLKALTLDRFPKDVIKDMVYKSELG